MGVTVNRYRISFYGDENGLKFIVMMVHNSVNILKISEFYPFRVKLVGEFRINKAILKKVSRNLAMKFNNLSVLLSKLCSS